MGIGLRELIIILLVVGIIFLPWFRKIAGHQPPPKPPIQSKAKPTKQTPEIIDAEWEEVEDPR